MVGCACTSPTSLCLLHQVPRSISKDRSQSVPAAPTPTTQQRPPLLPFGGGHFGPLNGLRQLVSPRTGKDQVFSIPLEEVLEELEQAGVAGEEGYSTERVLQVGRPAGWVWPHGKSEAALDILHWYLTTPAFALAGVGLGVRWICQLAQPGLQHGPVPGDPCSRQGPSGLCYEADCQ